MDRTDRGGVVVTGASTGIGRATAAKLDSLGFRVFAGVRKEEDAEALRVEGLDPLLLDVTDSGSIEAAATAVGDRLGGQPLSGVVNNAGIVVPGPLELIDLDDLRRQLEVNSIAPVAITQAFLPRLRSSRGRIVNVSSIGGRVAQPFIAAYVMSKFAVEAMTDSLRRELLPWGIDVVAVQPGTIKTPMWDKGRADADELMANLGDDGKILYGAAIEKTRKVVDRQARFA